MNPPPAAIYYVSRLVARMTIEHGINVQSPEAFMLEVLEKHKQKLASGREQPILTGVYNLRLTAFIQLTATLQQLDAGPVDGFWGPQTQYAFELLQHRENNGDWPPLWRDWEAPPNHINNWPGENEAALIAFYGPPCNEAALITVDLPFTMRLAWDLNTSLNRIRCHNKVADSVLRILKAVRQHYGDQQLRELRLDRFGGCYNPRRKRGGTAWSTHAWGIALDFDPDRNQLNWGRNQASLARPEYEQWWKIWENEGWISLGRKANYDWMHVQATC
jgi:hypothetical protein